MADQDHLDKINDGEDAWIAWRTANPTVYPDLSGVTLSDLPHWMTRQCHHCNLNGAVLGGFFSHDAIFDGSTLHGAKLEGTMDNCSFRGADLQGIVAKQAGFYKCIFDNAVLSKGDPGTTAERPRLLGANVMTNGVWIRVDDSLNSTLSKASFYDCSLVGVSLICAIADKVEFYNTDLSGAVLDGAFLRNSEFQSCSLENCSAQQASFANARFTGCLLDGANFAGANLSNCEIIPHDGKEMKNVQVSPKIGITGVESVTVFTSHSSLRNANLSFANLRGAKFIDVNMQGSNLDNARVYGVSAWGLDLTEASQRDLVITRSGDPKATVDDLELAQFVHLMLSNGAMRRVVETITSKLVLLLGRFSPNGLQFLHETRDALRSRGYVPIIFDWPVPTTRNLTETVGLLASMAKFVIADLSDPRCVPQELHRIVPHSPSIVIQPVLIGQVHEYAMFKDFLDYPWCMPVLKAADGQSAVRELLTIHFDLIEKRREVLLQSRLPRA